MRTHTCTGLRIKSGAGWKRLWIHHITGWDSRAATTDWRCSDSFEQGKGGCTCVYVCMHTCIHAIMHAVYTHTYIHAYIHACIHTYTYIHTYKYIWIRKVWWQFEDVRTLLSKEKVCVREITLYTCMCINRLRRYIQTHKHASIHRNMHTNKDR